MLHPLEIYNEATREVTRELSGVALEPIYGELPPRLKGVLFRNGPGRLVHHGYAYDHLFDGDGMVQRFQIGNGEVRYTNRYVRTREFTEEEVAGRPLYRSFGTNLPGGVRKNLFRMHFKNAANTSLLLTGGNLLALWEGGAPHALDPITLETRGLHTFGGKLAPKYVGERAMNVGRPFAAHYRKVGNEYLSFGLSPGIKQRLLLHRLSEDGNLAEPEERPLPHLSFVHDFVATAEGARVFFLVPVAFRVGAAFVGLTTPVGSIVSRGDRTTILLLTEEGEEFQLHGDPCYVFHFVNGYREGDKYVVDLCRMNQFPTAEDVRALLHDRVPENPMYGYLTRYTIDPGSGSVARKELFPHPMELPRINANRLGRNYRYAWSIAASPEQESEEGTIHGVAKYDVESGAAIHRSFYPGFPGEPLFVPDPDRDGREDGGWLLMLLFNVEERRTELRILDAETLVDICVAPLPEPVHLGFHGIWTDDPAYIV